MVKLSDLWFRGETVTSKDRGMKFGHGLLESPGRGIISGNQLDKWMGNSKMFFFEYSPRLFGRELYPMWLADMLPPIQLQPTTTNHHPSKTIKIPPLGHEPPTFVDHKTPGHEKVDAFGAGESCDGRFYLGRATWKHQSLWTLGWWLKFHVWSTGPPQK